MHDHALHPFSLNALSGALITDRKRYEKSNEKVTIQ